MRVAVIHIVLINVKTFHMHTADAKTAAAPSGAAAVIDDVDVRDDQLV
jgi:hypothetical protein